MTEADIETEWARVAAEYIADNLPTYMGEWDHSFTTAYQIGCEALAALGYARETARGAVAVEVPRLPVPLPRKDDIATAVLYLAGQNGGFHQGAWHSTRASAPVPNVGASQGLPEAHARADALAAFEALGLVADGVWTEEALPVAWRNLAFDAAVDFESHPLYLTAVEMASAVIPDDIRARMDALIEITEDQITDWIAFSARYQADLVAAHRPGQVRTMPPKSRQETRRSLEKLRLHDLDELFETRWRLLDGWLSPDEADRGIHVFHDTLARELRRDVTTRVYPHMPFLFSEPSRKSTLAARRAREDRNPR